MALSFSLVNANVCLRAQNFQQLQRVPKAQDFSQVKGDEPSVQDISSQSIVESSGLAVSHREPGIFWTHNDSGGEPKLFAINRHGKVTGSVTLEGAKAIDWEDMASFKAGGKSRLVVGDFGDNDAQRSSVFLYFLDEPNPREHVGTIFFQRIEVRYPDGAHDCEAIGVDMNRREVWMVTKSFLPVATCYSMPLPQTDAVVDSVQVLTRRGAIAVPLVSAMDIDPRSGELVIANYFQCFRYARGKGEPMDAWMTQIPAMMNLPKLKQIEAIAFDDEGMLWVTSEGRPGKLARVSKANNQEAKVND